MKKLYLMLIGIFFILLINFNQTSAISVAVHVPEKYVNVVAGERFYFEIEIKYPENPQRKDLRLNYQILTQGGEMIAQSKVLKAVETQASFIDFILIPEKTKEGIHKIKINIEDYENLSEEIEASFHVISKNSVQIKLYFYTLISLVVLIGTMISIEIYRIKKK